jgi:hypothetical protein
LHLLKFEIDKLIKKYLKMKKYFLMAVACVAMAACGGNSQDAATVETPEELNNLIESINESAAQIDAETKALIEKQESGVITEEEKTTLIQKLKAIGAKDVVGQKTLEAGVEDAKAAVEGSKEEAKDIVNQATDGAVEKVEAAKKTAEDVKAKADNIKESAEQLKDAVNALKKK